MNTVRTQAAQTLGPARPETSGADTSGGSEPGTGLRSRIDELDARIIALVQERRTVAAGIGHARAEAGGPRKGDASQTGGAVGLAREMEILNRYRSALGRPGTQLAMTLLALCRTQS